MSEIKSQRVVEVAPTEARLVIRLEKPENCYVSMSEVGLDRADFLPIAATSTGEITDGKVFLSKDQFDQDIKAKLQVTVTREVIGGYVLTVEVDET